jgi:hypothetical protein
MHKWLLAAVAIAALITPTFAVAQSHLCFSHAARVDELLIVYKNAATEAAKKGGFNDLFAFNPDNEAFIDKLLERLGVNQQEDSEERIASKTCPVILSFFRETQTELDNLNAATDDMEKICVPEQRNLKFAFTPIETLTTVPPFLSGQYQDRQSIASLCQSFGF